MGLFGVGQKFNIRGRLGREWLGTSLFGQKRKFKCIFKVIPTWVWGWSSARGSLRKLTNKLPKGNSTKFPGCCRRPGDSANPPWDGKHAAPTDKRWHCPNAPRDSPREEHKSRTRGAEGGRLRRQGGGYQAPAGHAACGGGRGHAVAPVGGKGGGGRPSGGIIFDLFLTHL